VGAMSSLLSAGSESSDLQCRSQSVAGFMHELVDQDRKDQGREMRQRYSNSRYLRSVKGTQSDHNDLPEVADLPITRQ